MTHECMSAMVIITPTMNPTATELSVGVIGLGNRSDGRRQGKKQLRNGTGRRVKTMTEYIKREDASERDAGEGQVNNTLVKRSMAFMNCPWKFTAGCNLICVTCLHSDSDGFRTLLDDFNRLKRQIEAKEDKNG